MGWPFYRETRDAGLGCNLYYCPCKNQCKQEVHRGASEFVDKNILTLLVTILRLCFSF